MRFLLLATVSAFAVSASTPLASERSSLLQSTHSILSSQGSTIIGLDSELHHQGQKAIAVSADGEEIMLETETETEEAEENVVVLAELANSVYGLQDSDTITLDPETTAYQKGYRVDKLFPQAAHGQVKNAAYIAAMAVYKRTDANGNPMAVLAIKGTSPGSLTDIKLDLKSVVGGQYPQASIDKAKSILDATRKEYGYNRVLVTGHSLGGYLGEIVSTTYNVPGATFCAPGPDTIGGNTQNGDDANKNFHNINGHHEQIGNFMIALFGHKQWSIFVEGMHKHGLGDMIAALKLVPHITEISNKNVIDFTSSGMTGYWLHPTWVAH